MDAVSPHRANLRYDDGVFGKPHEQLLICLTVRIFKFLFQSLYHQLSTPLMNQQEIASSLSWLETIKKRFKIAPV